MLSKLGGRKTIISIIIIVLAVIVDINTERGLSSNLKDLLITVIAIFVTGNTLSKVPEAIKAKKEAKDSTDIEVIKNLIDNNNQNMQQLAQIVTQNFEVSNAAIGEILRRISGGKE